MFTLCCTVQSWTHFLKGGFKLHLQHIINFSHTKIGENILSYLSYKYWAFKPFCLVVAISLKRYIFPWNCCHWCRKLQVTTLRTKSHFWLLLVRPDITGINKEIWKAAAELQYSASYSHEEQTLWRRPPPSRHCPSSAYQRSTSDIQVCFDRCKTLLLLLLSQINTQYTTHDVEKINTKQALSAVVVQINVKKLLISNTRKMHYLHLFSRQGAFSDACYFYYLNVLGNKMFMYCLNIYMYLLWFVYDELLQWK